jgi:hypothetical protein
VGYRSCGSARGTALYLKALCESSARAAADRAPRGGARRLGARRDRDRRRSPMAAMRHRGPRADGRRPSARCGRRRRGGARGSRSTGPIASRSSRAMGVPHWPANGRGAPGRSDARRQRRAAGPAPRGPDRAGAGGAPAARPRAARGVRGAGRARRARLAGARRFLGHERHPRRPGAGAHRLGGCAGGAPVHQPVAAAPEPAVLAGGAGRRRDGNGDPRGLPRRVAGRRPAPGWPAARLEQTFTSPSARR